MLQTDFEKKIRVKHGKREFPLTYRYHATPQDMLPYQLGVLMCGGRYIGHVRAPKHLKRSEEYNAILTWIVNDIVAQGYELA